MTHSEAALPISLWWAIGVAMVAAAPIATVWNIAAMEDGRHLTGGAAIGLLLAVAVASPAIVGGAVASIVWFRWLTVAWWLVSAALFFVYGLGIGFVPLALASGLTVKSLGRAGGDSEVPGVR